MADEITRKQFIHVGVATLVAASLGACASDDGDGEDGADSGDDGGECTSAASANIATNHGHSLSVPAADINGGAAMDYGIQGTSDHDHTVALSAGDMAMIAAGETVSVTSSSGGADGHSHEVALTC